MGLLEIKNHMINVRIASLSSLCLLFNTDAETLRYMLSHWIRKGKMRQCTNKPGCGTKCFKCPTTSVELYEWVAA
jgi:putative ferrous iron transport protein C